MYIFQRKHTSTQKFVCRFVYVFTVALFITDKMWKPVELAALGKGEGLN